SIQKREISGVVMSTDSLPISGVTVRVVGSAVQTTTGQDGTFSLTVETESPTLSFSSIGYKPKELNVEKGQVLRVVLEEMVTDMDEIVVVGMNLRQTKRSVTGAMSTIETKELKQSPVANLNNALAGRLPGLISVQHSGQPGSDAAELYIRGISTYGGNTAPLIVIDGLPRSAESFSNIDPNEVESISIL